ncbi:GroES-like protein [Epithele typhae]|uniref:GroES-like protein n=1 Tax=Epithele typhae TaxID=378194 RepID=UPI002007CAC4|nr:GroES-like protein [Epithele typhae]KAH9921184.1 GroES-like protein [Epithele typhae]
MAPTVQKALISPSKRAFWVLRNDWPVPKPQPTEVRIKVMASALNFADCFVQIFSIAFITKYPWVGGYDVAGVIDEIGSEVTDFAKGDRVVAPAGSDRDSNRDSGFQEYCVCFAQNVAKIPDRMSFDAAASIPLALTTAVAGMWSADRPENPEFTTVAMTPPWEAGGTTKYAGKPAFILGGATSVGQFAIQAVRMHNFSPIIVTASLRHTDYLTSLGATHVIDRNLPAKAILAEVRRITKGAPVAYASDAVGDKTTQLLAFDSLAPDGRMSSVTPVGPWDRTKAKLAPGDTRRVGRAMASFRLPQYRELGVEVYKRLPGWLETGALKPTRVQVLPGGLKAIPQGLRPIIGGKVSGVKLVVNPPDTPEDTKLEESWPNLKNYCAVIGRFM